MIKKRSGTWVKGTKRVDHKKLGGGGRLPLRSKSKSERSEWIRKNDAVWQEIVKFIYEGRCALCGGTSTIAGHHIFAKGACGNLRHDVVNGIALCYPCHFFKVHTNPEMHRDSVIACVIQKFGTNAWDALRARATKTEKITTADLKETYTYLKEVLKNYKIFQPVRSKD
jgi:predicted restriction endonuclease